MNQLIRRGAAALELMPQRLGTDAVLRVSDQGGRTLRRETLRAGTDLRERLQIAWENYQRQGYTAPELRSGQWAFVAEKGAQRLMVAIRDASTSATAATSSAPAAARS